jgi:hypothetical protein
MDAVKKIQVNGREYALKYLPPVKAYEYWFKYFGTIDPHLDKVRKVRETIELENEIKIFAIRQCLDPMLKELSDAGNFDACFSAHPEDLIPLGNIASGELIALFLKKNGGTTPTAKS